MLQLTIFRCVSLECRSGTDKTGKRNSVASQVCVSRRFAHHVSPAEFLLVAVPKLRVLCSWFNSVFFHPPFGALLMLSLGEDGSATRHVS